MNLDLSGKRAIVCGSTQGIGRAAAEELADLGAEIILLSRNGDKLREVANSLDTTAGQQHSYIVADFSRPESLRAALQDFLGKNKGVHILVNNTGGPPGGPITGAREEEFLNAFSQHLICNHILTQALTPYMKEQGYGRIINVISTSVKVPLKGLGVSNTVRGAVANWAKTMSIELAAVGITVNNVLPGATGTGRLESIIANKAKKGNISEEQATENMLAEIPANRFAEPSEVANAIAFLASPAASYINGINLPVDGGRTGSL